MIELRRLAAVACLSSLFLAGCPSDDSQPAEHLAVYCAAGVREPMTELAADFEADHPGVKVDADFGGSGVLLGRIQTAKAAEYRPDIYVAGDEFFAGKATDLGLIDRTETLAYFVPVIVTAKGNPKGVGGLADLARDDVRVALGEARAAAIGRHSDLIFRKFGLTKIRDKAVGSFDTVQQIANAVVLGHADAGIIWDATARQHDYDGKFDVVPIPGAPAVRITICRVKGSPRAALADAFIERATRSDAAARAFERYGFTTRLPAGVTTSEQAPRAQPAGASASNGE